MKKIILASALSLFAVSAFAEDDRLKNADGQPCYYFSSIEGTQKDEIYVQSSCLSQEGQDWISGKMTAGADDLTQDVPTYYGFRTELRKSVVQGYSDQDEAVFQQFKSSGVDSVIASLEGADSTSLPAANGVTKTFTRRLPPQNGAFFTIQRMPLPVANGEMLIRRDAPADLERYLSLLSKRLSPEQMEKLREMLDRQKK